MTDRGSRQHAWRTGLLVVVGVMLVQAAWILAVPPYRGIDEFDHAYRAAAVARGEWAPSELPAENGRGGLLPVPQDIVRAAEGQCLSLPYTGPENCVGRPHTSDTVLVASAASTQTPLVYAVAGWAALPFDGAAAGYAMRIAVSLLGAVLIGWAAWCVALWSRTRWPLVALLGAVTPVFVYSTMVPAGNGLEIAAATALWAALLGVVRTADTSPQRRLLIAAVVPALLLVSLRQLGPVFALVILVVVGLVAGRARLVEVLRRHGGVVALAVVLCGAAAAAHVVWVLAAGYGTTDDDFGPYSAGDAPSQVLLWFLQGLATGPFRNQPAPLVVYPLLSAVWIGLSVAAWRVTKGLETRGRLRLALVAAAAAPVVLPLGFTVATYTSMGAFWQGRYGLPMAVGVLLVAGYLLDHRSSSGPHDRFLAAAAVLAVGIAHVVNPVGVLLEEQGRAVSRADAAWWAPSGTVAAVLLVGAFATAGAALLLLALRRATEREELFDA